MSTIYCKVHILITAAPEVVEVTSLYTAYKYNQHQVVWDIPEDGGESIIEYVISWRKVRKLQVWVRWRCVSGGVAGGGVCVCVWESCVRTVGSMVIVDYITLGRGVMVYVR